MKKILALAVALLLAVPSSIVRAVDGEPIDIIILDGGSSEGGQYHRAPALIPISASYYPTLSSLLLDFRYDLGAVTVSLENLDTGAVAQSVIIALPGAQLLPVSCDTGSYRITFTLTNGRVYTGTFEMD